MPSLAIYLSLLYTVFRKCQVSFRLFFTFLPSLAIFIEQPFYFRGLPVIKNDVVIGIAASGRTPYVIGGVEYAKEVGAKTACITTCKGSILASIVDYPVEAITGAEVINGSTRMKSGTAQKLICNMISTATFIKMGKVYEI